MKKKYPYLLRNSLRISLAAAIAVLVNSGLQAQTAPSKQWDRSFGGTGYNYLEKMQQTSDGGYILGGTSDAGIRGIKRSQLMAVSISG